MRTLSFEKDKLKFLLLEGVHPTAVENLKRAGYQNIEYHAAALERDELKEAIKDAHFIGIRSRTRLDEEILKEAHQLMAIGCFCIGTNQVDLNAALRLGIPVFNAPFSNTRSVAELVLGEILLLLRKIPEANAKAHRGEWQKSASGCHECRGKNLGIIGYGHIGTQLGILAESLGMQVSFYDIETKLPLGNAQQVPQLAKLLKESDIVTLHVPETALTKNMIGEQEFALMKEGSLFLNASRGTVVHIDALCRALESKKLAGAAIDVFPVEPASNKDPFISPLCRFDNVILTPHIGGSTQEAQENIGLEVTEKLMKYSSIGSTVSAVNFPEVSLPPAADGVIRLLHIHENRPGMMKKINEFFDTHSINIAAQYLQTHQEIGYVVLDIETDKADEVLDYLSHIDGTIMCRILF